MTNITSTNIKITKTVKSKINDLDFSSLSFGQNFTDHMFVCNYANGSWSTPEIIPYAPMQFDPSSSVFHYGQAVFEGMKAYKDDADKIWLFRAEDNLDRINKSSERLAMPSFPKSYFFAGLEALLKLDSEWIKKGIGNSLYVRPFLIATDNAISASPSQTYKFMIICSPAQSYYSGEVRVLISEDYSRAADGGIGYAKAAGNYAGQFFPTNLAKEKGYQQIIWTDANNHEYLEEAGTMNIFFRINDNLVTAPTNDRILDGITRKSIIQLAKDKGIVCEVRPVKVSEIKDAFNNGSLKEIFGTGTAAVINPILGFGHQGQNYELPKIKESYATMLKDKMLQIQYNKSSDPHGWRHEVL